MRKLTFLAMTVAFLGAASCSSSDDSSATEGSIIGKWEFSKVSYIADGFASPENDYSNNEPACARNYLEIKEDGTADSGDYTPDCVANVATEPWTRTGNTLFMESGVSSTPDSWEIISVTDTELRLRGELTGLEGTTPGVELFINLIFEKE